MMEILQKAGEAILNMISFSYTGIDELDWFIYYSSIVLQFISAAAVVILLIKNPRLRQRKRPEDRFMFWECILVLILLGIEIFMGFDTYLPFEMMLVTMSVMPLFTEFIFMLIIMQWMVFVDYSLYRSPDHIRRRYRFAILPIIIVMGIDAAQLIATQFMPEITDALIAFVTFVQYAQVIVELCYILTAVRLVIVYGKECREPRFLRLSAFIVPFILANLVRPYDASLMALGILLTYLAVLRRDRFLDHDTQFYNRAFLEYTGKYRDKKQYTGGNGILVDARGHGEDMAGILRELKPQDSNVYVLEKDHYLLLSESLRGSAVQCAVMNISEAAKTSDPPYSPKIITIKRGKEESADAFATRLLESDAAEAASKGVTI